MARGINKVFLLGNVGADPETRQFDDGTPVTNLSLATNKEWKDKVTGEKKESTEWHRVVLTGGLAEIANQYVRKGSLIHVEGEIKTRSWEQDGQKRYTTEIRGWQMEMLNRVDGTQTNNQNEEEQDDFDDDVPF